MANFVDSVPQEFITKNDETRRQEIVTTILTRYPDRVPVLVGRATLKDTPPISKYKYLVPADITFGKFVYELRRNMTFVDKKASLFFFLSNNTLAPSNGTMSELYKRYKSSDGFLYITYAAENTFGFPVSSDDSRVIS
jgi:GABA(A) receptor-associated protein